MLSETKCYHFISDSEYMILKINCELDAQSTKSLLECFKDPSTTKKHMVVNCENMRALSSRWLRILLETQNNLKNDNFKLVMILVAPELKQFLKMEGLDTSFVCSATLREGLQLLNLSSKKKLDTDFINPFLDAAMHVLNVQAGVTANAGKFFVKKIEDHTVGDVSGIIGIVSESFRGSVIISFPEQTFLNVMSGMLGEKIEVLSKDILDGAGEITNMIFGQAKIILNDKGYGIKMAIPSVISGKNHSLSSISKGTVLIIPFQSTAGDFCIEICLA